MCIYTLFKQEAAKKVGQLQGMFTFIVRVNTVWYVNFCGNQIFMDFVRFLLYAWYNIFLDIRISACQS